MALGSHLTHTASLSFTGPLQARQVCLTLMNFPNAVFPDLGTYLFFVCSPWKRV